MIDRRELRGWVGAGLVIVLLLSAVMWWGIIKAVAAVWRVL